MKTLDLRPGHILRSTSNGEEWIVVRKSFWSGFWIFRRMSDGYEKDDRRGDADAWDILNDKSVRFEFLYNKLL